MNLGKKITSLTCALSLMAGLAAGCSSSESSKPDSGDTSQSGSQPEVSKDIINFADFASTLGAGWNLGNTLEANSGGAPIETVWGNPEASQEMLDAVAAAGFKTVRVPVSYLSMIDDANDYKIDETWLNRVNEVVDYCYNADLNVIINIHGDGYYSVDGGWLLCGDADQDIIRAKYGAVWRQIAEQFKDYDEHLIFESMNEEFDNTYTDPKPDMYENINQYNQIFVDTVRQTGSENSHRWLMVPGWNTNIDYTVGDYGFRLPEDSGNTAGENRTIVSVHCYDPWDYCGQEDIKTYLWGERGQEIIDINGATVRAKAKWGEEEHIQAQLTKLKEKYIDNGIPVIIGEYGCIDKTHADPGIPNQIDENRAYWNGFFAGTAAEMGITPVYWDNGWNGKFGFGLFDRKTCQPSQPEIIDTIVRAVENKDPKAGMETRIKSHTSQSAEEVVHHAYIGIQTDVFTFRNSCSDSTYGKDSQWFDTLIRWEDTDGDGKDDIVDTGATFTDLGLTADGAYTVAVSGYDFSSDTDGLNMLFISTDLPYSTKISFDNFVLYCDDMEVPIEPIVMEDSSGNFYIDIINVYNTELAAVDYEMPKDSFRINFTVTGVA